MILSTKWAGKNGTADYADYTDFLGLVVSVSDRAKPLSTFRTRPSRCEQPSENLINLRNLRFLFLTDWFSILEKSFVIFVIFVAKSLAWARTSSC